MQRVSYTIEGSARFGWFDSEAATLVADDVMECDGNNWVSLATRTQLVNETLFRTPGDIERLDERVRNG